MAKEEVCFKILLIGDAGVGKSSILVRYVNDTFTEGVEPATGIDSLVKYIDVDGKRYKLQIWDTAGQERFRTITSSYYRGAHAVIVVYDVCDHTSFENCRRWIGEIDRYASDGEAQKMLCGTKIDMDSKRTVSTQDGQEMSDQLHIPFCETSAKTRQNIDELFQILTKELVKKSSTTANQPEAGQDLASKVQLQEQKQEKKREKKNQFGCLLL